LIKIQTTQQARVVQHYVRFAMQVSPLHCWNNDLFSLRPTKQTTLLKLPFTNLHCRQQKLRDMQLGKRKQKTVYKKNNLREKKRNDAKTSFSPLSSVGFYMLDTLYYMFL